MDGRRKARPPRIRKRVVATFSDGRALVASGVTMNVSTTGLAIQAKHVQSEGSRLSVRLTIPGSESIDVEGIVVWARPGSPGLGIHGAMGMRLVVADERFFRFVAESVAGGCQLVA